VRVLLVGAGVIGSVYGILLARSGHQVDVLAHDQRAQQIKRTGLCITDIVTGAKADVPVSVQPDASREPYDLVLI
jgi:ketopantoate reductase